MIMIIMMVILFCKSQSQNFPRLQPRLLLHTNLRVLRVRGLFQQVLHPNPSSSQGSKSANIKLSFRMISFCCQSPAFILRPSQTL